MSAVVQSLIPTVLLAFRRHIVGDLNEREGCFVVLGV